MLKLSKASSVVMQVTMRLPTDNLHKFIEGTVDCRVKVLGRDQLNELLQRELPDEEFAGELLVGVEGLGNDEGVAYTGEEALRQFLRGDWSTYLVAGFMRAFFEQFGDVRVKNSKASRGR